MSDGSFALMAMKAERKKRQASESRKESDEDRCLQYRCTDEVDGVEEEWLVNFKMKRACTCRQRLSLLGGAATCLGGAIRDPVSGTYLCIPGNACDRTPADPGCIYQRYNEGKLPQEETGS